MKSLFASIVAAASIALAGCATNPGAASGYGGYGYDG